MPSAKAFAEMTEEEREAEWGLRELEVSAEECDAEDVELFPNAIDYAGTGFSAIYRRERPRLWAWLLVGQPPAMTTTFGDWNHSGFASSLVDAIAYAERALGMGYLEKTEAEEPTPLTWEERLAETLPEKLPGWKKWSNERDGGFWRFTDEAEELGIAVHTSRSGDDFGLTFTERGEVVACSRGFKSFGDAMAAAMDTAREEGLL